MKHILELMVITETLLVSSALRLYFLCTCATVHDTPLSKVLGSHFKSLNATLLFNTV